MPLASLDGKQLGRVLVLCDREGCELELLHPDSHALLGGATLLVELHDSVNPNISRELVRRFSPTHDAEMIFAEQRDVTTYEELAGISEGDAELAIWEKAEGASWGLLRPLSERR